MKKALIIFVISLLSAVGLYAKDLTLKEVINQSVRDVERALQNGNVVAVVNFASPSEVFSDHVIEELTGALVNGKKVVIVDRRNLDLIRQEMDWQLSGYVSDESMQSIGQQLGAQYIVSGSLTNMGRYYRFRIKVTNVETAAIRTQNSLDLKNDSQVTALIADPSQRYSDSAYYKMQKAAMGVGAEVNMNSTQDFAIAGGARYAFDYSIGSLFGVGLNLGANLSDIVTFEAAALFRWYFFKYLFLQADAGIWLSPDIGADSNMDIMFLGGGSVGIRLPVARNMYIEPYVRGGYPFMLGVGVIAGVRMPFVGADDPIGGMKPRPAPPRKVEPKKVEPPVEPVREPTFEEEVKAIVSEIQNDSIWLEFDSEGRARLMVSVVFAANSTEFEGLSPEIMASNERTLKYVADILKRVRYSNIIIEGHSNPTSAPGPARNREENELKLLSRLRALTVVDELRQLGVNLDRRNVQGAGSDRLVSPYNDAVNNWKNRRVEFILVR